MPGHLHSYIPPLRHLGPHLSVHNCPLCNRGSHSHLGARASAVETLYPFIHDHLYCH